MVEHVGQATVEAGVDTPSSGSKAQLLRAAYRVIVRRGASGLSLREVADEAGLSRGLVHYHFENKDDLVAQALMWALRGSAAQMRRALTAPEFVRDPLTVLVNTIFVDPDVNHTFYLAYLSIIEHIGRREADADEFAQVSRDVLEGLFEDVIGVAASADVISRTDADEAARDLRTIIDGVFAQWLQESDRRATHDAYRLRCRRLIGTVLGERTVRA